MILDAHGVIRFCNASLARIVGRSGRSLIAQSARSVLPGLPFGDRTPGHDCAWTMFMSTDPVRRPLHLVTADGSAVPVEVACETLTIGGEVLFVLDIRRRDQESPDASLRAFAWSAEQAPETTFITDVAGVIEYVNPAFEALTGFSRVEVIGRTPVVLRSGAHHRDFYATLWATILSGQAFRGIIVNRRKNGEIYHEEKTIRPFVNRTGKITHFISTGRDVSDRVREVEGLRHAATHDSLTDLPNRTLFLDRLGQALRHAARRSEGFAVAVIDIDGFKVINDRYGHLAGDAVLKTIAFRIQHCVRAMDTVARLGGDELTLILMDTSNRRDTEKIIAKVVAASAEAVEFDDRLIEATVSIGASLYPQDGVTEDELRKKADRAMYRAKRSGGNRHRFFGRAAEAQSVAVVPGTAEHAEDPGPVDSRHVGDRVGK